MTFSPKDFEEIVGVLAVHEKTVPDFLCAKKPEDTYEGSRNIFYVLKSLTAALVHLAAVRR